MNTGIHDASDDHFNAGDLLSLTADDAGMRRGLRDIFLDESPRLLARISDALAQADAAGVADAAHALRSLVATVGGRRAFILAATLESAARSGSLAGGAAAFDDLATSLLHLGLALSAFVDSEDRAC